MVYEESSVQLHRLLEAGWVTAYCTIVAFRSGYDSDLEDDSPPAPMSLRNLRFANLASRYKRSNGNTIRSVTNLSTKTIIPLQKSGTASSIVLVTLLLLISSVSSSSSSIVVVSFLVSAASSLESSAMNCWNLVKGGLTLSFTRKLFFCATTGARGRDLEMEGGDRFKLNELHCVATRPRRNAWRIRCNIVGGIGTCCAVQVIATVSRSFFDNLHSEIKDGPSTIKSKSIDEGEDLVWTQNLLVLSKIAGPTVRQLQRTRVLVSRQQFWVTLVISHDPRRTKDRGEFRR